MDKELGRFVSALGLEEVLENDVGGIDTQEAKDQAERISLLLWHIIESVEEEDFLITVDRRQEIFKIIDMHYQLVDKCGGTDAMKKQEMSPEAERDGFKRVIEFNSRTQLGEDAKLVLKAVQIKYPNELQK